MKKNLLSKLCSSLAVLTACLTLFTVVLPFGTITFGSESGVSYDSQVSTASAPDDDPDYINYR